MREGTNHMVCLSFRLEDAYYKEAKHVVLYSFSTLSPYSPTLANQKHNALTTEILFQEENIGWCVTNFGSCVCCLQKPRTNENK